MFIVILTVLSLFVGLMISVRAQRKLRTSPLIMQNSESYLLPLTSKENLTHDTVRFRFNLPSSTARHALKTLLPGQHIYLTVRTNLKDGNKEPSYQVIKRVYSPVTAAADHARGYFDLVIKIYPHGKMTQYLNQLKADDNVEVSWPRGNLILRESGLFALRPHQSLPFQTCRMDRLGFIAGGTGITSMFQLIKQSLENSSENSPTIWLLYSNHSIGDILFYRELVLLSELHTTRFHLWFTLTRLSESESEKEKWKYSIGRIDEHMIRKHMPLPIAIKENGRVQDDDLLVCCCGPSQMVKQTCLESLKRIGYRKSQIHIF